MAQIKIWRIPLSDADVEGECETDSRHGHNAEMDNDEPTETSSARYGRKEIGGLGNSVEKVGKKKGKRRKKADGCPQRTRSFPALENPIYPGRHLLRM